jgi:hypothetical protein
MDNDCGVIYVATGKKYLDLAAKSAESLISHCPQLPIHIYSDFATDSYDCFDSSTIIPDPHVRSKVDYIYKTPFKKTLFLDADTIVCEDISGLFGLLDKFDYALVQEGERSDSSLAEHIGAGTMPKSFPVLNSGVILFKATEPVINFFKSWEKAYHDEGLERDQLTLRGLIWSSSLKLGILPPEYNVRRQQYIDLFEKVGITPKILHFHEYRLDVGLKHQRFSMPLRKKIRKKVRKIVRNLPIIEKMIFGSYSDNEKQKP